ncbi:hypothetical protein PPERSA_06120 [Pseudocohnilembus persalinus]|uniref:Uncharacterized protein n=1 Tax=Pseudocohnilembus persalinus TaxID=266149 RepID=A0A0V0QVJ6_PSEPJ|nr:hypothetical protein PPERSA_06120 [Pseudocohnilembus persalinus]|eukprot:KRX06238.1 hypothetical protein PPERSA_06120 [Pseudocohnilembus persalinus]
MSHCFIYVAYSFKKPQLYQILYLQDQESPSNHRMCIQQDSQNLVKNGSRLAPSQFFNIIFFRKTDFFVPSEKCMAKIFSKNRSGQKKMVFAEFYGKSKKTHQSTNKTFHTKFSQITITNFQLQQSF